MAIGGVGIVRDNFGKLLEPGLRKIVDANFRRLAPQYSQFLNVANSSKAIETDLRMGGFGLWDKKGSLDSTLYQDPTGTDSVQYKHETFSSGFLVEKELVDDEKYNEIRKMAKYLGESARQTVEIFGASILNNAYTAAPGNYKGEALISANHKRLDGGSRSNFIGALALNEANLEIAHKLASEQVDERGLKIETNYDTLIVPRGLELTARKILGSQYMPTTGTTGKTFAENDINPMKDRYKIVVLDYVTDQTAWYLQDSAAHELNFFWREKLSFKNTTDFDTDIAKYKGRFRMSGGWTSDLGILGAKP